MHPECDLAIEDIVSEAIVSNENQQSVQLDLSKIEYSDSVKKKIRDSFSEVLKLLQFDIKGHDIFRRWYVDGRLYYHKVIDKKNPKMGVMEMRFIEPRKIKKVRELVKAPKNGSSINLVKKVEEYYLYNERGMLTSGPSEGIRISPDSITFCPSGLVDANKGHVLSYLHLSLIHI